MLVRTNPSTLPVPRKPASAPQPAQAEALVPQDVFENFPSNYVDQAARPASPPDESPPALPRPVIFLHGYNGEADRWGHLQDWLISGEEPVNRYGGIIDAGQFDNIDAEANLFTLRLSRPYNSVERNAAELKATVEAVCAATGAQEVDLVVHSLGGLDARQYLMDENEKVKHLIMMGTPNHGSQLANLELLFREKFGFPLRPPVDDTEVRTVLHQLSVDRLDRNGEPRNPYLRNLNDNWDVQRSRAEIMVFTANGVPTVTGTPGVTIFGDGVVTRRSAVMPEIKNKHVWWRTHGGIQDSGKVMENTAKFLADQAVSEEDELFDTPEDRARWEEVIAPKAPLPKSGTPRVQQATQLPILDPAFQFGLGLGVLSAMMGGEKSPKPLVELDVLSLQGNRVVDANYTVDLDNQAQPIIGSGTVDGSPLAETAHWEEGRLVWTGQLGEESDGLALSVGEDERSIDMAGSLAGVDADLSITMVSDDDGRFRGIRTAGTLNGEPYLVESLVEMDGLFSGEGPNAGHLTVHGTADGQDVQKSYRVAVQSGPEGFLVSAEGAGLNAGTPQAVGVQVRVVEREG